MLDRLHRRTRLIAAIALTAAAEPVRRGSGSAGVVSRMRRVLGAARATT